MLGIETPLELFHRGYADASIAFSYIPDLGAHELKEAYTAGLKLAYKHRDLVKQGLATWPDLASEVTQEQERFF